MPRDRMKLCIKLETFGLSKEFLLKKIGIGDKVACYVTKEKKVIGFGAVTKELYYDETLVFGDSGGKIYPNRICFSAKVLSKHDEIDFMEVLPMMDFFTNPAYWAARFASGVCEISESDWNGMTQKINL